MTTEHEGRRPVFIKQETTAAVFSIAPADWVCYVDDVSSIKNKFSTVWTESIIVLCLSEFHCLVFSLNVAISHCQFGHRTLNTHVKNKSTLVMHKQQTSRISLCTVNTDWGSCDAVGCLLNVSSCLHAEVFLGKILNPKFLLTPPSKRECLIKVLRKQCVNSWVLSAQLD